MSRRQSLQPPLVLAAILLSVFSSPVASEDISQDIGSDQIEQMLTNMWRLAQAGDGYLIDNGMYPSAQSVEEYVELVRRPYLLSQTVNFKDAWGNEIMISSGGNEIEIRTLGSDGIHDDSTPGGMTSSLSADIVIQNREYTEFVQYPREYCDSCPPRFCKVAPNTSVPADRDPRERGSRPLNTDR